MSGFLTVHYVTGILVALVAALFVWRNLGRRVMLYLLTLQIVLGIVLMQSGLRAPSAHYALAVLAWFGYMAATVLAKRPERRTAALALTVACTLMVLVAFYLGQHAAAHGAALG